MKKKQEAEKQKEAAKRAKQDAKVAAVKRRSGSKAKAEPKSAAP